MRAHKNITRRKRRVLRELTLNRQISLICVGVLEVLIREKREWQNRAKAGERLVIKPLAPKLVLRAGGGARRTVNSRNGSGEITDHNGTLENLRGIEKRRRRRIVKCQSCLLLLGRIGNIRIEGDSQKRVIVKESKGGTYNRLAIILRIPRYRQPGRNIVFVARESLLYAQRVLGRQEL